MANSNPRWGEEIIRQQKSGLGHVKLVATEHFQQFLDDLATIDTITADDLNQELTVTQSDVIRLRAQLKNQVDKLTLLINDNVQLLAIMESNVQKLAQQERTLTSNNDDLEQLAHVN